MHPAFQKIAHRPWELPRSPWFMRQSWLDLLFAHWPLPARLLRPLVPPQLEIQEFDGSSWVGLVPFRMEGVAPRFFPDLPGLSAFPELNLRMYVETGGKPGVWFISLDATKALAVWAARRFFHLPYFQAEMKVQARGQGLDYHCIRKSSENKVVFQGSYEPLCEAFEAKPGSLEHFLTERYCLYAQDPQGSLWRTEIHHIPWPLQLARCALEENSIGPAQGIPLEGPPALLHFSRRQEVVVWPPQKVDS